MANKIIQLTEQTNTTTKLEVYSDLDLLASPATLKYRSLVNVSDYISPLSGEVFDPTKISKESDLQYILDDPAVTDDEDRLLLLLSGYTFNADNSYWNKCQRKKAQFKLEKDVNVNAIMNSLRNIFTWIPGERILNPEFGSRLREYLYEGITDFNKEQIVAEIRHCITEWEPRVLLVKVVDMSNAANTEDNTVVFDIVYTIPTLNDEQYHYMYKYLKVL